MLTQPLPILTYGKILKSILNNPTTPCDIFMGAIEWNLWNNDKSLTNLSNTFSCNKDVVSVYTAVHNKLFNGIAMPIGQCNSYDFMD